MCCLAAVEAGERRVRRSAVGSWPAGWCARGAPAPWAAPLAAQGPVPVPRRGPARAGPQLGSAPHSWVDSPQSRPLSATPGHGPATGTAGSEAVLNVVNPVDPPIPAATVVLRNDTAWLLDPLTTDELTVTPTEGKRTTGRDTPAGATPPTPTLHAAAADAPAARLASIAARTGERCIAGAERPTTASGAGRLVGTAGTAKAARSNNASSSRLDGAGVAAVRKELSSRRSASTACLQPGQIETCWSQARRAAAGRVRSAYALSIASTCREAATERARGTRLIGPPELPDPKRIPDGPAMARPSLTDRERGGRGPHAAASDLGGCASGPCRA
jgi:hypothetical protein